MKEKQKWLIFDEESCVIIVPNFDSKPHGQTKDTDGKLLLAGFDCPCKPKMSWNGEKPMIIHNSFFDKERIDKSMGDGV